MQNQNAVSEREQYYLRAKRAKDALVGFTNFDNFHYSYQFVTNALARALEDSHIGKQGRKDVAFQSTHLLHLLDLCRELREAEGLVKLLEECETSRHDKAA